jgi:hypothetical protein
MPSKPWLTLFAFGCLSGIIPATSETPIVRIGYQTEYVTTITLAHHVDYIVPPPPVRVLPQTTLRLELDEIFADATDVIWYQDGKRRDGSDRFLSVIAGERGAQTHLQASVVMNGTRTYTHGVSVVATDPEISPLQNLSTKIRLTPLSPDFVVGFVVGAAGGVSFPAQRFLVRAIGPGLTQFGVAAPLSDPVIKLQDSSGRDRTPGLVFPDVVYPDGSTPATRYQAEVDQWAHRVGAFPAPTKIQGSSAPRNIGFLAELLPGAYTLTVSSISGSSGEVLLEIYRADE